MSLAELCLFGLAILIATSLCQTSSIDFKNPVRSAAEDEITNLPGLDHKPNFKQYSGYLKADDKKPTNRFWHYWFVESQSDPTNDPLVLWLNGGPGCSSLLGLLTELGPFRVAPNNSIISNPYAWNKKANVVFMESPAGVGFSYSVDGDLRADDDTTANQNHLALKSFLEKFPQFKNSPLYLTGESYGGVYLPTLGVLVDKDPELNLKGVAIGNGYLDANKLAESLVYFSYYHGLIGKSTWQALSQYCCSGKPPARGQCNFFHGEKCLKYVASATDQVLNSGLNPYNLYDNCYQGETQSSRPVKGREHFDKSLMLSAFNLTSGDKRQSKIRSKGFSSLNKFKANLREDPPCTDDRIVINYLNRQDVKQALHIPALKTPFTTCSDNVNYTMIYPGLKDGLAPQIRQLLKSPRGLTLLIYNGDVDMMCNFFGDEWFVDDLGRELIKDYRPWYTNGQVSGFVKFYRGITYVTVKGSGHMVPTDRPAEALNMFTMFLGGMKPGDVN